MTISSKQKYELSEPKKETFKKCGFGIFEVVARMDEALLEKIHEDAKNIIEGGENHATTLRQRHESPEVISAS